MYRLARFSVYHPKAILAIVASVTVLLGAGVPRVQNEYGYRVLIGDQHPTIVALDEFIDRFGGGLPTMFAWECGDGKPCAHALDASSLGVAQAITERARELPEVRSVSGPASSPLLIPDPGGFAIRRFVENGEIVGDLDALRDVAVADTLWSGRLLEADGSSAVVYVHAVDTESETGAAIIDALEPILERYRAQGYEFHLVGDFVGSVVGGRRLTRSMEKIVPALVVVIAAVLLLLTRSWKGTLFVLLTMGAALAWTTGLMGWLGWPQDGIHEALAPLILVVGVCDAVHLLTRVSGRPNSESPRERILGAASAVGPACLVTTTTTTVAFLSFTTSDLDSFFRFGSLCAFGVSACLVLTFSLLPVLTLGLDPTPSPRPTQGWASALNPLVLLACRRSHLIVGLSILTLLLGGLGSTRLQADTDWIEGFGRESDISRAMHFGNERYRTVITLEVELTPPPTMPVESPQVLDRLELLAGRLAREAQLGRAWSAIDHIKRMNQLLHDGDPAYYRIGKTRELNAQILELVNLGDDDVLSPWLSIDRRSLRMSVQADLVSFSQKVRIMEKVDSAVRDVIPPSWKVKLTGTLPVNRDWVRDVQQTQLRSFPTAFALVFVLIALHLRSAKLGLIAMVPTLVPVTLTLGLMGWLGTTLDVGRSMVAAIVIGIGVDDAIHFIEAYRPPRRAGASAAEAAAQAIQTTGSALVTTSISLALGFLTLTASAWQTISSFGFLVSFTIVLALVATILMLPALLVESDTRRSDAT